MVDQLRGARFGFQPRLTVSLGGVLGERFGGVLGRTVDAETGENQRRIGRFGSQHMQADLDQGLGAEHQALPALASYMAR